jgi:hypothetical protein
MTRLLRRMTGEKAGAFVRGGKTASACDNGVKRSVLTKP